MSEYEPPDYMAEPWALPDGIDFEDYIIGTYIGNVDANINVELIGPALAIEQSTGTWTPVPAETPEVRKKHVARVIWYTQIPDYEFERPGKKEEPKRKYVLSIAFPVINMKNQIPIMLTATFGNISMGGDLKMVDLRFPKSYLKDFSGPKFGIEGVRKVLNVPKRPLLNNMIKPCVYTWNDSFKQLFFDAAVGGCDIIKDDELVAAQDFNRLEQRVPAYMEMVDKAKEETGENTIFTVNITDNLENFLENADKAQELGANGLMVNYLVMGLPALRKLAEDPSVKVPILAHMDFAGAMYMSPWHGVSSHLILGKLARLAGADIIVHPAPYGKASVISEKFSRVAQTCRFPMANIKPMFPMPSGGITASMVDKVMKALGNDIVIGSGGGIHAHPDGPRAGAIAFRQAIDATMQGIALNKYAKDHKELAVSMGLWSGGKIKMG
ncbi:MAG: RuBisCO large subunit C-terminal-like domain-containing protein [Candidatus Helarchaeota archaeon]